MASIKDHFLDLERHRRQLEENVEKLRKALQHWRLCDAEYEELKEEVKAILDPASRADLDRIRQDFEGQVVTQKEVKEIFGEPNVRSTAQIVNLLSRRIDYVSKNVETLEKQLEAAEQKYAAATIVVNPDVRNEEGLPITDIIEELDDDDNVTSFRLQRPGDVQPQIREALEKAGIKDLPETNQDPQAEAGGAAAEATPTGQVEDRPAQKPQLSSNLEKELEKELETEPTDPPMKKGVSFTEDTKPGHNASTNGNQPKSRTAERVEQIIQAAKEQEGPLENPVIPSDESAEDAELRREMLRYSMTEIAPIVAKLEIDEGTDSDFEYGEFDYDEDYDDDQDEDEHGRYKYRVVDDDYRKRMEELEVKLGIKSSRQLVEEDEDEADDEANGRVPQEGIARIAIQAPIQPKSAMKNNNEPAQETKPAKKGVKFASALDIAHDTKTEPVSAVTEPQQPFADPMKSTIVERSAATQSTAPVPSEPKKTSRFKKTRSTGPTGTLPIRAAPTRPMGPSEAPARFLDQDVQTAPTGPEGKTLAGKIIERDAPTEAKEPDEFDPMLLHQEAAVEYHRLRNRMIQRNGGFAKETEAPIEYPEEEENGRPMSRFKAARLAGQ